MSAATDAAAFANLPPVTCPGCTAKVRLVNDGDGNLLMVLAEPDPAGELEVIAWDTAIVYAAPLDKHSAPEDVGLRLRRHAHDDGE